MQLHEFGHSLTAVKLGGKVQSITLLPIGGMANISEMPEKPKDEFIVSAAGPLVNIIIAGILWVYLSLISPADLTQILIVIGFFIFLGAKGEYEMMKYRDILNNYKVKDIVKTDYEELDDNESLGAATEKLVHMSNRGFVIKSGGEYSGILTKNDLIKGLNVYGKEGKVKEVVNENIEKVNPGMTLFDVFKKIQMNRYDIVPVLDGDIFKGILDLESINEFFLIQNARR